MYIGAGVLAVIIIILLLMASLDHRAVDRSRTRWAGRSPRFAAMTAAARRLVLP